MTEEQRQHMLKVGFIGIGLIFLVAFTTKLVWG